MNRQHRQLQFSLRAFLGAVPLAAIVVVCCVHICMPHRSWNYGTGTFIAKTATCSASFETSLSKWLTAHGFEAVTPPTTIPGVLNTYADHRTITWYKETFTTHHRSILPCTRFPGPTQAAVGQISTSIKDGGSAEVGSM